MTYRVDGAIPRAPADTSLPAPPAAGWRLLASVGKVLQVVAKVAALGLAAQAAVGAVPAARAWRQEGGALAAGPFGDDPAMSGLAYALAHRLEIADSGDLFAGSRKGLQTTPHELWVLSDLRGQRLHELNPKVFWEGKATQEEVTEFLEDGRCYMKALMRRMDNPAKRDGVWEDFKSERELVHEELAKARKGFGWCSEIAWEYEKRCERFDEVYYGELARRGELDPRVDSIALKILRDQSNEAFLLIKKEARVTEGVERTWAYARAYQTALVRSMYHPEERQRVWNDFVEERHHLHQLLVKNPLRELFDDLYAAELTRRGDRDAPTTRLEDVFVAANPGWAARRDLQHAISQRIELLPLAQRIQHELTQLADERGEYLRDIERHMWSIRYSKPFPKEVDRFMEYGRRYMEILMQYMTDPRTKDIVWDAFQRERNLVYWEYSMACRKYLDDSAIAKEYAARKQAFDAFFPPGARKGWDHSVLKTAGTIAVIALGTGGVLGLAVSCAVGLDALLSRLQVRDPEPETLQRLYYNSLRKAKPIVIQKGGHAAADIPDLMGQSYLAMKSIALLFVIKECTFVDDAITLQSGRQIHDPDAHCDILAAAKVALQGVADEEPLVRCLARHAASVPAQLDPNALQVFHAISARVLDEPYDGQLIVGGDINMQNAFA